MTLSKVSFDKSRVFFSANTNLEVRDAIGSELSIKATEEDLGRYFGVPIINDRTSRDDYHYLIDRINAKLAYWKTKTLSMAGKATLVQSCLSTIPYYSMQTTQLPYPFVKT